MGRLMKRNISEKRKIFSVSKVRWHFFYMKDNERNGILLNGILITLGLLAILDNLISHWLLGLHRILPNPTLSTYLEVFLFILGLVLFVIGICREIKGRRT